MYSEPVEALVDDLRALVYGDEAKRVTWPVP
jgi:hypothetical protein